MVLTKTGAEVQQCPEPAGAVGAPRTAVVADLSTSAPFLPRCGQPAVNDLSPLCRRRLGAGGGGSGGGCAGSGPAWGPGSGAASAT